MEWLKRAFCGHSFEKIGDLKDSETDTSAIKVIRMCTLCGYTVEQTFSAPPKSDVCVHRWDDMSREVERNHYGGKTGKTKVVQKCGKCGEYKSTIV